MEYREIIKKRNNQRRSGGAPSLIGATVIGVLSTAVSAMLLLLTCTAVAMKHPDPNSLSLPFALFSLFASSFTGGLITRKYLGNNSAFAASAISSALLILLILAGRLLLSDGGDSSPLTVALCLMAFLGASELGAYVGKPRAVRKKRRR